MIKNKLLSRAIIFVVVISSFNLAKSESIAEYLNNTKDMLKKTHANDPERIEYNEPVLIKAPSSCSQTNTLVLVHGLKSSPYLLKGLSNKLSQKCLNVFLPLLDGHGTKPEALLYVTLEEWKKSVSKFVDMASKEFSDEIYLGGVSLGGALSVDYALKDESKLKGLILFDAALQIDPAAKGAALVKNLKPFWAKLPEDNLAEYESLATNAVEQIYNLTQDIKESNNIINIPTVAHYGIPDNTIKTENSIKLLYKLVPKAKVNIFLQPSYKDEEKYLQGYPVTIINSEYKKGNINVIGSAHQSSILDVNDPYLGLNGNFKSCVQYYSKEKDNYSSCLNIDNDKIIYGETTKENLEKGLMRRITFNPYFDDVVNKVINFIYN